MELSPLSSKLDSVNGEKLGLLRSPAGALVKRSIWSAMQKIDVSLPSSIDPSTLWPHQLEAVRFALARKAEGGSLLAMDMGTGKLLTSLLVAHNLGARLILMVSTKRAVDEWQLQLQQWWRWSPVVQLPAIRKSVRQEVESLRRTLPDSWRSGATVIVMVNYQRVWLEPFYSFAKNVKWDLVIADEVHKLKSPGGKVSKALYHIGSKVPYRLGLTGTPFPHSPIDIYATARFIDDKVYGTRYDRFMERYAIMGGFQGRQIVGLTNFKDLVNRFWSIAYRVDDSVQDLPRSRNTNIPIVLNPKTMEVYRKLRKEFVVKLRNEDRRHEVSTDNTLTRMLRLMQIVSGYVPNDDGELVQLGQDKEEVLEDTIDRISPDETVIVFANFHPDLDAIERVAKRLKRPYGEISGRRSDYLDWRQGKMPVGVMGVQFQAGSESINLSASRVGLYYNLPLSLDLFKQSRKRLLRPGQKRKVVFGFLIAKGTWDVKTKSALIRREDVIQRITRDVGKTGAKLLNERT